MVLEIAQIDIKPGMEAEFESGVQKAAPLFKRAKGCTGMELQRSIELPHRYRLFVQWATVENHTDDFPRLGRFRRMAQAGRPLFRAATACRACAAGREGVLRRGRELKPAFTSRPAARAGAARIPRHSAATYGPRSAVR